MNETTTTEIWIDGKRDDSITVKRFVNDLDEAARLFGYPNYQDLFEDLYRSNPNCDEMPLNFVYAD